MGTVCTYDYDYYPGQRLVKIKHKSEKEVMKNKLKRKKRKKKIPQRLKYCLQFLEYETRPTYPARPSWVRNEKTKEKWRYHPRRIGIRCLAYTNGYRQKKGLPPLKWFEGLHDIGIEHSRDLLSRRVPWSHKGFRERRSKAIYRYSVVSFAENLGYIVDYPLDTVAEECVLAWINSHGHNLNLLTTSCNFCAVAVAFKGNEVFLTQLFMKV